MTTTFKSLGHLIDNAVEIHRLSAPLYRSLQRKTSDSRCEELLAQMANNETRMAHLLEQMVARAGNDALDTRLQYTREQEPRVFIESLKPSGENLGFEQIGRLGEQLHSYLIDLLEGASDKIPCQEGEELLQDLIQLEKAEGRSFSRNINAANEM